MRHLTPFPTSEARCCCSAAAWGLRRALRIAAIRLRASCFLTSRKEIFFTVNSYINAHVMTNIHQRQRPSADEISIAFIPSAPAPLVAPRNIVPAGEVDFFESAPAVTQLLVLRRPAARAQAGAFRAERGCSLGEWR